MVAAMVGERRRRTGADRRRPATAAGHEPRTPPSCSRRRGTAAAPGADTDPFPRLRAGEVVGLAGHAGSGTRRIALSHRRATARTGPARSAPGRRISRCAWDPHTAVRSGVTLVPEDRIKTGLVGGMSIEDNITLDHAAWLDRSGCSSTARPDAASPNSARPSSASPAPRSAQPVGELSGGNQQKVLLGAALGPNPTVLVLMHPTAGVDIASKATIMQIVEQLPPRRPGGTAGQRRARGTRLLRPRPGVGPRPPSGGRRQYPRGRTGRSHGGLNATDMSSRSESHEYAQH